MFDNNTTLTYAAAILRASLLAASTITPHAMAADIAKANNANALNLTTSWIGGTVPGLQDRAVFDQTVIGNKTTSLGADAAWSGIVLSGNGNTWTINGAFTLTLGAGGIDLSLASANFALAAPLQALLDTTQTWTVTNGRQITVSAPLAGNSGVQLVKDGEGTLVINTNSTYTGGTILNSGTLSLGNGAALGTGDLTISGGVLRASSAGHSVSNDIVLAGPGAVNNTVNLTLAGNIRGTGSLTRASALAGTLILSGTNSFTGGTVNGSVMQLNTASALGTGTVVLLNGGTLQAGMGGFGTGNNGGIKNSITLDGNATVAGIQNLILSGVISGDGSLKKSGTSHVVLSASNTYTGGTTISGGSLRLGHVNSLGSGALTITGGVLVANANLSSGNAGRGVTNTIAMAASGTINSQGLSLTISGTISGTGQIKRNSGAAGVLTLTGDNTFSGGLTNMAGSLVLGHANALGTGTLDIHDGSLSASADLTAGKGVTNGIVISTTNGFGTVNIGGTNNLRLSGIVSGTSGITKTGSGTLFLSGGNTYSGDTTVSNGVLALDASGSLAAPAGVHIAAGAQLDVSAWPAGYTFTNGQALTGYGTVTGSVTVAAGGRLSAGTTNDVGTLTFLNDLTLNSGVVIDWNADSASESTDIIRVKGTLRLPAQATIRISGTSTLPRLRVLFRSPKIEGAANVPNWSIQNGPQTMRAVLKDDQVVLLYTGMVFSLR